MIDLVIVGGGPAGLAAAYSAWQHGLRDILILELGQRTGRHPEPVHSQWLWSAPLWGAAHRPGVCRTMH